MHAQGMSFQMYPLTTRRMYPLKKSINKNDPQSESVRVLGRINKIAKQISDDGSSQ